MSNELELIGQIYTDERVKACSKFAEKYHLKWLFTHQTKWQTIHGTLSDGHERLTDAQKFSGALREARGYALEISRSYNNAKILAADHIDALEELAKAQTPQEKMRAEGKVANLELALEDAKIHVEGLKYMLDAALEVAADLEPKVLSKYKSFEDSERDNNIALVDYRAAKRRDGYDEHMPHAMLDPETKAIAGLKYNQLSLTKALEHANPENFKSLTGGNAEKMLAHLAGKPDA